MEIKIIKDKISLEKLRELALATFGDMVKVVVDIERGIMAVGGEMHYDAEQVLLEDGSQQQNLWGANIYPDEPAESRIVYDSLINIRPRDNNRTTLIQDEGVRAKVRAVIDSVIEE